MKPATLLLLTSVSLFLWQPSRDVARAQEPASPAPQDESKPADAPVDAPAKAVLPRPFPADRYAALLEKSPFAIASAAPEPVVAAENFATNWVLAGLSKQKGKSGEERYTVFVRSRDLATRLVISADKPSDDGVSLVSVDENAVAAKSTAILRKGSETGRVEFDQAVVAAAAAAPPPQGQPGKPGGPSIRTPAKGAPIPRPGMQGTVPRPGASQGAPNPAVPMPGAPQAEPRRRIRPIQEPP